MKSVCVLVSLYVFVTIVSVWTSMKSTKWIASIFALNRFFVSRVSVCDLESKSQPGIFVHSIVRYFNTLQHCAIMRSITNTQLQFAGGCHRHSLLWHFLARFSSISLSFRSPFSPLSWISCKCCTETSEKRTHSRSQNHTELYEFPNRSCFFFLLIAPVREHHTSIGHSLWLSSFVAFSLAHLHITLVHLRVYCSYATAADKMYQHRSWSRCIISFARLHSEKFSVRSAISRCST